LGPAHRLLLLLRQLRLLLQRVWLTQVLLLLLLLLPVVFAQHLVRRMRRGLRLLLVWLVVLWRGLRLRLSTCALRRPTLPLAAYL